MNILVKWNKIIFPTLLIILLLPTINNANSVPIYAGDEIHLLCTYEKPITGCRFIIPNEPYEIELFPRLTKSGREKFDYFGKGFDRGECGITIQNISIENQGHATCILTIDNEFNGERLEFFEVADIKILNTNDLQMSLPKLKIINDSPLKVGHTLVAECALRNDNKLANITWLLDDDILNGTNANVLKKFDRDKRENTVELKSLLQYQLKDIDNERTLKCRTEYGGEQNEFVDSTIILNILNASTLSELPQIGQPFDISINFSSYPRPLSLKWKVNEKYVYYGKASNEFSSKELKSLNNSQWKAVLTIANVTSENLHYNYTLQVDDSKGRHFYSIKIDDLINTTLFDTLNYEDIEEITTKKLKNFDDESLNRKHSRKLKSSTYRRRTTTKHYENNTNSTVSTERRIKIARKPRKNTTISITEMTSVTTSPTTHVSLVSQIEANTNTNENVTKIAVEEKSFINIYKDHNEEEKVNATVEIIGTTDNAYRLTINEINITNNNNGTNLLETNNNNNNTSEAIEKFFTMFGFIILTSVLVVFLLMLCHYRRQVSVLKTEIIQMNLENYYNQSCLYPPLYNNYSSSNFQRNGNGISSSYDDKGPINLHINDDESACCSTTNNHYSSTYNSNSNHHHLYQSIDDDDDDFNAHVYAEILTTKASDGLTGDVSKEKPNNYENNESFNNLDFEQYEHTFMNENLIPRHCHSLMTIHEEEEEYEASQFQKLSKLESTYI